MKKIAIISLVTLIIGAALGGYGIGVWKDKARDEAVAAAIETERAARADIESELSSVKLANEMAAYQIRLGKISIDASRLNYGTAKDEAVQFFTDLSEFAEKVKGTEHEAEVRAILENRDQIVSDLSVGSPTAAESLQRIYIELTK